MDWVMLGEHIKAKRIARGWTVIDCAEHAQISSATLLDLEKGAAADVLIGSLQRVLWMLHVDLQLAGPSTRPTLDELRLENAIEEAENAVHH